ncbi:trinucleotide repeat-containing gene 6C protein isoform X2 [Xenopus laevis]|uniref:Trinucleotide repeat-containing gene 6C protein n=1 Tax=Xenopus laevis TaxID=8355 RepID=A0A8J1LTM7_XENLA|nr:trinucleotide repeat-containing gene 6C protein isoform X2 [Xenopus laevis]
MQPYLMTQRISGLSTCAESKNAVSAKTREKEQEIQKEEHLMEEKKKKKQEEKKKKEGAQKKAAEQKTKVPEPTKTVSQPQPAAASTPTSTVQNSNGKRASANGQQSAASRYLPREVPPRFRQQEQKQLLKRGQPLPAGTLAIGNPTQDTGQARVSPPPPQGAGGAPHPTKNHSDLSHSGLGDHYENSHWGLQPSLRGETGCSWDKVIIDRTDKEAWPSITGTESESASECTTDTDSASNCGSEKSSMATSAQGNFTGHTKKTNGNNGTNGALIQSTSNQSALGAGGANGNGNLARVWGVAPGSSSGIAHCPVSGGDGKVDSMIGESRSHNCWGASNPNTGINLNLNPNANPAAWPVLGHEGTLGGGSPSSISSSIGAIGQNMGSQNGNATGTLGAWRNLQSQESTEPQTSNSQNVSFSVQPQNLNTDGPNNTNPMNSSPNLINAMQTNGLPNWGMAVGMGGIIPPHLQGLPGANGSVSQVGGVGGDSTASSMWGLSQGGPSVGSCNSGFSQEGGDVVSSKQNGCTVQKDNSGVSAWDSGPPTSPGMLAWGRGRGNVGSMHPGSWGHTGHSTSNGVNGEWSKVPNQHSSNDINVKGSTGWDSPSVNMQNTVTQQGSEQMNARAKTVTSGNAANDRCNSAGNQNEGKGGDGQQGDNVMPDDGQMQLPRQDLDPRVLSNTGWGQVPVKQNIAWEFEEFQRPDHKNVGTEAWGGSNTQPSNSGGKSEGSIMNSTNTSSVSGWMNAQPVSAPVNASWGDKTPNGPGGWGEHASSTVVNAAAKSGHTWSASTNQEDKSPTWSEPHKSKPQGWADGQKSNASWNSTSGDWTDGPSVPPHMTDGKKNGTGWDSDSKPGSGWNENSRPGTSGWGNGASTKNNSGTGWGEPLKAPQQNWANKPQENNLSGWGGAATVKQNGSVWVGGPVPATPPAKQKDAGAGAEPTGWEEPSPPSIRRKMEIDDGTSAWGEPSNYNSKTVNMWDRNNPVSQTIPAANTNSTAAPTTPPNTNMVEPQPTHQPSAQQNRSPLLGPGWGDLPPVNSKTEASWGEPPSPSAAVDNGTSTWGKPSNSNSGWGDGSVEPPGTYGRTCAPAAAAPMLCKPAPKSMQEGWGSSGEEVGLASQWEEDEGDMWNNATSQDSNSSCNSWAKKGLSKVIKTPSKSDEVWIMSRLTKQLTDMGFPKEPSEEALKSNNMNLDQAMSALLEKKVEMDKRGLGLADYNVMVSKPLSCRQPPNSKESSMDRPTFLDKDGGLAEEPTSSPFLPSPSLKLPHPNSALPNQALGAMTAGLSMQNLNSTRQMQSGNMGMFGNSGAAQARSMQQQQQQQPPVQPLNSSQPSLRAQVPQFLSPQVQAQLLQFAAKNIGLNPALLTSPINPQHMTMLNQLYQLQLAYQRLQLQQQMLQAQRNVSGPMRQQEQQVARTINNMQQQIQQHQRQLAQALLMKQQQPPPPHAPLHPPAGKSALDSFSSHTLAPGLSDLHTKEQQSSFCTFPPYPLVAGLNPGMNVNNLDMAGSLSVKDSSQSQSRLPQWTHPNAMDSLTNVASPHDPTPGKPGALPGGLSIGPGKSSLDDSYSRYDLLSNSESPNSPPVPVSDSWSRAKSESEKISNGSNINWPPEFHPGVPWKGLQNIDPENDPDVTPGSVHTGPTINTTIQDVNRYLLKSGGKLSDIKSTWSSSPISHTQASLSHELWKVPRNTTAPSRPPPGLTNAKPSSAWSSNQLGWTSSYSSGSTWSTDSSGRTSSWLVLRNLTPQIDGSTLRTLCLQHGPLITFHLNLTQGNAVVRYSSKEEATKAQKSLHMCVLGNTTILAEFAGEEEVNRFLAQGQPLPPTSSWQSNTGNSQPRLGSGGGSHTLRSDAGHWNPSCLGSKGNNDLLWGGVPQYSSSLWGPPGTEDARIMRSPTPLNTLLPGDLLSGESI